MEENLIKSNMVMAAVLMDQYHTAMIKASEGTLSGDALGAHINNLKIVRDSMAEVGRSEGFREAAEAIDRRAYIDFVSTLKVLDSLVYVLSRYHGEETREPADLSPLLGDFPWVSVMGEA